MCEEARKKTLKKKLKASRINCCQEGTRRKESSRIIRNCQRSQKKYAKKLHEELKAGNKRKKQKKGKQLPDERQRKFESNVSDQAS